jgi:hypothetical protein
LFRLLFGRIRRDWNGTWTNVEVRSDPHILSAASRKRTTLHSNGFDMFSQAHLQLRRWKNSRRNQHLNVLLTKRSWWRVQSRHISLLSPMMWNLVIFKFKFQGLSLPAHLHNVLNRTANSIFNIKYSDKADTL